MHYWISYYACQALGVPQPQAKGPPGPGGYNNVSNSVLEGFLFFYFTTLWTKFMSILEIYHLKFYIFSGKQYYQPNVCVKVITTYLNINI